MELCCFCTQALDWMEAHDKLAGWAQFAGGLLAVAASWGFARAEGRRATLELNDVRDREEKAVARQEAEQQAMLDAKRMAALVLLRQATRKIRLVRDHIAQGNRQFLGGCAGAYEEVGSYYGRLIGVPLHEFRDQAAIPIYDLQASNVHLVSVVLKNGTEIPSSASEDYVADQRVSSVAALDEATKVVDKCVVDLATRWNLKF